MSLETMTKIGTVTVGAGTDSSITFSNIPQTYTDLIVKVSGHLTGTGFGAATVKLIFNSSTSGYSWRSVFTDSAGGSYSQKGDSVAFIEAGILPASQLSPTLNVFGVLDMLISNYSSNNSKAVSIDYAQESGSVDNYNGFVSGIWVNTAPITSLTITPNASNFSQYSTFTLYGVKSMRAAVGNSIKATGGAIAFDGTYVTHTFNTSGSFTPTTNLLVDYLVVAGGGGGGSSNNSGGGGAGGLRSTVTATGGGGSLEAALSLTGGNGYTVTIGAGGAGGVGSNVTGTSGSNSVFSSITSTGGGGGGGENSNGAAGGSSGGGGYNGNAGTRTASPVQGNNGANGSLSSPFPAGGGGGAGAAGSGAQGGNGQTISIAGSSITYGGGGSGGRSSTVVSGGTGGGGSGGQNGGTAPTTGTVNSGGGGGGGAVSSGAAGGSGIVIVRYKG